MRTAFIESLLEIAQRDSSVWLINADLGFSVLEPFAERFPERYLNVGVAEQNMVGVAAGLALSGFKVFLYSIGNFPTMRCLEQLRNDVCYHNAHVIVVAVGGGFSYGTQGYTHHAIEDLAVMRSLPGMRVAAPGDPHETRSLVAHLADRPGPGYLRLGRAGEPLLHEKGFIDAPTTPVRLRTGDDVTILTTGGILGEALKAADLLLERGIRASVVSAPMLKPFDDAFLAAELGTKSLLVTLEEHSRIGGLCDTVAPIVAAHSGRCRLLSFAVPDAATRGVIGDQHYMRQYCGIDAESVANGIVRALKQPA